MTEQDLIRMPAKDVIEILFQQVRGAMMLTDSEMVRFTPSFHYPLKFRIEIGDFVITARFPTQNHEQPNPNYATH
jgi:hypothetical protein